MRRAISWAVFDTKTSRWLVADEQLVTLSWVSVFDQATLFPTREQAIAASTVCGAGAYQLQKIVATWVVTDRENLA